ncbi:MAG: anaerobic ribonucleoside-triphosphate reductase activating protein [Burkholderiales bacterium]|jgi:pyruvate formate lyase activating enzyme|nr:MAG: anaerobic ribonucleoside-triphosphate reductase activating protein [Burkholderiales bacterium]
MNVATLSNHPSVDKATLDVGGFTPLSTTDWPDHLAAVVFVQGCPWRCHYCHNPALQPRGEHNAQVWLRVLDTLQQRRGLLDAVVFSGGEPTLDIGLPSAMETVRAMGFQVGLHTAGLYPKRLAACLPLVDWVALDIKTEFDDYKAVTSVPRSGLPAQESLALVLASGRACEFRTTYHPDLIDDVTLLRLARKLRALGVKHWVLQAYRPTPQTQASMGNVSYQVPDKLLARLCSVGPQINLR